MKKLLLTNIITAGIVTIVFSCIKAKDDKVHEKEIKTLKDISEDTYKVGRLVGYLEAATTSLYEEQLNNEEES